MLLALFPPLPLRRAKTRRRKARRADLTSAICSPEQFEAFLVTFYGLNWRRYAPQALRIGDRTLRGYVYGERPVPRAILIRILSNAEHRPRHIEDRAEREHIRTEQEKHEWLANFREAVQWLQGNLTRPPPLYPTPRRRREGRCL